MNDTVKVRILTDTHEHEDRKVPKGTVLEVSQKTATHLALVGAAEVVGPASAAPTKSTGGVE